jgi:hypothetical protein
MHVDNHWRGSRRGRLDLSTVLGLNRIRWQHRVLTIFKRAVGPLQRRVSSAGRGRRRRAAAHVRARPLCRHVSVRSSTPLLPAQGLRVSEVGQRVGRGIGEAWVGFRSCGKYSNAWAEAKQSPSKAMYLPPRKIRLNLHTSCKLCWI